MSKIKGVYRKKKGKKGKAFWLPIAFYGGLVLVAAICFVLGFGLGMGWDVVAAWFTSKWAALTIVTIVIGGAVTVVIVHVMKDKEETFNG